MKKIYFIASLLIMVLVGYSQTPELYKDINHLINRASIVAEPEFTTVGTKVFFIAEEPSTGKKLYVSDGTREGTKIVDTRPDGSFAPAGLTAMNGILYFSARDGVSNTGTELWRSDGTTAGTRMVKDIKAGAGTSSNPNFFTNVDGVLYFVADDNGTGRELWKSDGTEAGAVMVKDIRTGTASSDIRYLTAVGNVVYFSATNGTNGYELWKSDGTAGGTVMVKDIWTGSAASNPSNLTNVNGVLYFTATDGSGYALWKSDGTEVGTVKVSTAPEFANPNTLYAWNGHLFFGATGGLCKTDGTVGGTVVVRTDVKPDAFSGMIGVGSSLYFSGSVSSSGAELWKTDGTAANTVMVKDINPGTAGSSPNGFIKFNNKLYFATSNPVGFYTSDGTSAGTLPIRDEVLGGGNLKSFHAGPTKIYFTSRVYKEGYPETATGTEPWISDGTSAGTGLLKDINTTNFPSNPKNFLKIGNTVFFTADDGIHGNELWKTDGTPAGTMLVKDIRTGAANSDPQGFVNLNGTLYFTAYTDETGFELWKSDGTASGTSLVKDIYPGSNAFGNPNSSNPYMISSINGMLYFSANDGTSGGELWKSDGTTAGTVLVKDLNPGAGHSYPGNFTQAAGTIFFTASNGSTGVNSDEEIWKTDGTSAGTIRVKDIKPGVGTSNPKELTAYKNLLYFSANDGTNPTEMWVSDGTEAGTVSFREYSGGSAISNAKDFRVLRDTLYLVAQVAGGGTGIWKSDGTVAGTVPIKRTGSGSSTTPAQFTLSNGQIFFTCLTSGIGVELWKTDGTEAGTVLVKDLYPGSQDSKPEFLTDFKGSLYFAASGGLNRKEIWKSDGTESGTINLTLGTKSGTNPTDITILNDYLIFAADDAEKDRELFRIALDPLPLRLLDFTVQKSEEKALLKWHTTSEINTAAFEIERANKSNFVKIGEVAALNRSGFHSYQFEDAELSTGSNFYRLKMIDIDGKFTYSDIRRIDIQSIEKVRISPNPVTSVMKVAGVSGYDALQVVDASGKVVYQQAISRDEEVMNMAKLSRGNYVLRLKGKQGQKSLRFVKY